MARRFSRARQISRRQLLLSTARLAGAGIVSSLSGQLFPRALAAEKIAPATPTRRDLSPRERALVEAALPPMGEAWSADETNRYLRDAGTRSGVYAAAGMLLRNKGGDRERALAVIDEVLRWQRVRPGKNTHGIWPNSPRRPRLDPNWREFVSLGLIAIRERFPAALGPERLKRVETALVYAAEGSARRNVPASYTNVALMSAYLLMYAGGRLGHVEFVMPGTEKLVEVITPPRRGGAIAEFNSPTYQGVDLLVAAMWRAFPPGGETLTWVAELEEMLWRGVADFYQPGLRNLCGPYARAYGMDMTQYVTPTGLAIAFAAPNVEPPLPALPVASHELGYAPLFALAPPHVSASCRSRLEAFEAPRRVEQTVATETGTHKVTAVLERDWMMGAGGGLRGPRDQACPGTIHWRAGDPGRVGWLSVVGDLGVEPQIVEKRMEVRLSATKRPATLRVWLDAPGIDVAQVTGNRWKLLGMELSVETSLETPKVAWVETPRFGRAVEVAWNCGGAPRVGGDVLSLTPHVGK